MAIQLRRGNYSNFDPQKMKPAEVAVVQSGDPVSSDGKGVYVAIQAGVVKRLASIDEMQDAIYNQTEEVIDQIEQGLADDIEQAEAAADRAEAAAQTLVIDDTLTQTGQPADAKATGDEIANLKSIVGSASLVPFTYTSGYYINLTVDPVDIDNPGENATQKYAILDCSEGDKFLINGEGAAWGRAWGFINSSKSIISVSGSNVTVENLILTAPSGAAKLIVNDKGGKQSYRIVPLSSRVGSLESGKVDKQQSVGDAGKALIVDSSGLVTTGHVGLSPDAKSALIACFQNVAWINDDGQDYFEALYEALYGEPYTPEWGTDYTWLYKASDGQLLSANSNVSNFVKATGCTEELVDNTLHIVAPGNNNEGQVGYFFTPETNTNAKITLKVKFNSIPIVSGGGGALRVQVSKGSDGGARLAQKKDSNDSKYYISVRTPTGGQNVREIQLNTWYILSVELNNGSQILTIDGETVFSANGLNSYATSNAIVASTPPSGNIDVDVNIAWITYKNGDSQS